MSLLAPAFFGIVALNFSAQTAFDIYKSDTNPKCYKQSSTFIVFFYTIQILDIQNQYIKSTIYTYFFVNIALEDNKADAL